MRESWYDTAQICMNGHVVNSSMRLHPDHNQNFCEVCGANTISQCHICNTNIRGRYHIDRVVSFDNFTAPAFCINCGGPFLWTESRLKAARDLTSELDNLSSEERDLLSGSLDDIVKDTPQTPLAVSRFKRLALKAGQEFPGIFHDILVDIASETAKKLLWPS